MFNKIFAGHAALQTRSITYGVLTLLVLLLTCSPGMHAQTYNGTIVGTVTDASGAAVPGAKITAINGATGNTFPATTSAQGSYSIAQVPIGTYEIHIQTGNFKEFVSSGVEVHTASETQVNAQLQVGSV
jgi:hypothetical protein